MLTQTLSNPTPENCPGVESKDAGNSSACEGCPNQNICKTTIKGPDPGMLFIKLKY